MTHRETLNCRTLQALETISARLGRTSDCFCPAQDGSKYLARSAAFWWSVKAADWFIQDMKDNEVIDSEDHDGTCDFLFSLRECAHGHPKLHVDIDFIHEDEHQAVFALMGELACMGVTLAIMEKEEEEQQQVAGTA